MRIPGLQWEARCPQSFTQTRISGTHRLARSRFRYVWPSELDLMARLAGMSLRERWSGWKREPFTSDSTGHVSVWEKTAPAPRR